LEKIYRHVEVDAGDFQGMDNTLSCAMACGLAKEGIIDVMALEGIATKNKEKL